MVYRVGIIPYINMEPYRQLGEPKDCEFVFLTPKKSIKAIKRGDVLAAAIPVGGLSYVNNLVESIGRFGIAAKEASMSVLFFSKIPFNCINKKHRIALSTDSLSSVKLLYLLLGQKNGFKNMPKISSSKQMLDGELIIGDMALIQNKMIIPTISKDRIIGIHSRNWGYVSDLAQLWYEMKGYPFVFARWVVRKDAPIKFKKSISYWLLNFKKQEAKLVEKAVEIAAKTLKISDCYVKLYFSMIRRTLNQEDMLGQKLFVKLLEKYSKEPLFY